MRRATPIYKLMIVAVLFSFAATAWAAEGKGKIKSIEGDKNQFVLTDANGKDWTMTVTKETKVFLNDAEAKLVDLQAGDAAAFIYEKKNDKLMVSECRAKRVK